MSSRLRSLFLAMLALAATVAIAAVPGVAPQIALLATTAIIMGGAGHPLSTPPDSLAWVKAYRDNRLTNYVDQSGFTGVPGTAPDNTVVVITPDKRILGFGFDPSFTFRGIFDGPFDKAVADGQKNLDLCIKGNVGCSYNPGASTGAPDPTTHFIVYGYSQSSTVATLEKIALAKQYPKGSGPDVSFVLTANGNRPNGGILTRGPAGLTVPIIGLTFGNPTPTNTQYQTIDVMRQYDGWADQPLNPLNPFAEINSVFGQIYLHVNYDQVDMSQAKKQQTVGDTTYYMIPTPILPMLMPLESVPVVGHALADSLDPFFRVLVETGYDRTISPGTYTTFNLLYFPNPVDVVHNLGEAIPTGLDNGAQDLTGSRPLGTLRPTNPYGIGGPPVTMPDVPSPEASNQQAPLTTAGPVVTGNDPASDPVVTATTQDTQDPAPTDPVQPKRPLLTALNTAATRVQAQGEVRQNPLATPNGSAVLLPGLPGSGGTPGAVNGQAAAGSPLKQLGDAMKTAVDSVLKPKPATSDSAQ